MRKNPLIASILLGTLLMSCNLPGTPSVEADMMTSAALTVQAALVTPLASPTAGQANEPKPTAAATTPPASEAAVLTVGDVTNCRSGPDTSYERIVQIAPGQEVEIVGFFPPSHWVVDTDSGECWIAAEFTTPMGDYEAVPTVKAPSTPEGDVPTAPVFAKSGWTYFCYGGGQADITLSWIDKATDETGYRILRNGEVVEELPANSTAFAETIDLASGQSVGYQVQAYNLKGEANSGVATMTCP